MTRLIWRRWVGRQPTGIDRVCLAYLRRFAERSQAVVQHDHFRRILGWNASQELFALLADPASDFRRRFMLGGVRHARELRDRGRGRLYLNIGHTGLDSAGFARWARDADVRPIYLVHDLIPISHPEFCRPGEEQRHRRRMMTVLTTADGIIGNSAATVDELAQFAQDQCLPLPPAIAAWLGSDPLPPPAVKADPDRPTFVVLGTIEGRKNHLLLLDIWSRLVERLGDRAPRLLIIGGRGWQAERVFAILDGDDRLRGHVVELGNCSDDDIARRLASARALLFPSMAEGYGLPLVEALGLGVPVIASDLPVFREIAGDVPDYLGARDRHGWESAILDYAQPDSRARAAQIDRIKRFRFPDWDSHFDSVERWLATL